MVNVMLSGGIALVVTLLVTPLLIRFLVRRGYGQPIHDDLVLHHFKRGKPTMGGVVIIGATLVGYLGSHAILLALHAADLARVTSGRITISALLVLFLLVGLGLIGFLDDFTKIREERNLGLTSRQKLTGQALVTVAFAALALWTTDGAGHPPASTAISFVRDTRLDLGFAGPALGAVLFLL